MRVLPAKLGNNSTDRPSILHQLYSLYLFLLEELHIRECSDNILSDQLLQIIVLEESIPWTLKERGEVEKERETDREREGGREGGGERERERERDEYGIGSYQTQLPEMERTSSASDRGLLRVTSRLTSIAWGSIMCCRERGREIHNETRSQPELYMCTM